MAPSTLEFPSAPIELNPNRQFCFAEITPSRRRPKPFKFGSRGAAILSASLGNQATPHLPTFRSAVRASARCSYRLHDRPSAFPSFRLSFGSHAFPDKCPSIRSFESRLVLGVNLATSEKHRRKDLNTFTPKSRAISTAFAQI